MNKADLIDAVATKTGLGKSQASSAVESFLDVISEALTRGETVSLVGFGIFSVSERAGRVGRNPRTGEALPSRLQGLRSSRLAKALRMP